MTTPRFQHVAIDLDNTLVDTLTTCLARFNAISSQNVQYRDCSDYTFYELFGWDEQEYLRHYAANSQHIHGDALPYPDAVDVIQALHATHRITILTARPMIYAPLTIDWLARHQVPYHAISFNGDKLSACQANGSDLLIDDTPHFVEPFAQAGRPLWLYDHPYNYAVVCEDPIHRVSNWQQIAARLI